MLVFTGKSAEFHQLLNSILLLLFFTSLCGFIFQPNYINLHCIVVAVPTARVYAYALYLVNQM